MFYAVLFFQVADLMKMIMFFAERMRRAVLFFCLPFFGLGVFNKILQMGVKIKVVTVTVTECVCVHWLLAFTLLFLNLVMSLLLIPFTTTATIPSTAIAFTIPYQPSSSVSVEHVAVASHLILWWAVVLLL